MMNPKHLILAVAALLCAVGAHAQAWQSLGESRFVNFTNTTAFTGVGDFSTVLPACDAFVTTFTTAVQVGGFIPAAPNLAAAVDLYQCTESTLAAAVTTSSACRRIENIPTGGPHVRPVNGAYRAQDGRFFQGVPTVSPGGGSTASINITCARKGMTPEGKQVYDWMGEILHGNLAPNTQAIVPFSRYRIGIFVINLGGDPIYYANDEGGLGGSALAPAGIGLRISPGGTQLLRVEDGIRTRFGIGVTAAASASTGIRIFDIVQIPIN